MCGSRTTSRSRFLTIGTRDRSKPSLEPISKKSPWTNRNTSLSCSVSIARRDIFTGFVYRTQFPQPDATRRDSFVASGRSGGLSWLFSRFTVNTYYVYHRCKNVFYVFLFWSRFLRFLTFFLFSERFLFKKRWQNSERQAD